VKSYFLSAISSREAAIAALGSLLPGQHDPWLLKDTHGDAMAYFRVEPSESTPSTVTISVDISGRHHDRDADIVALLERLRENVGGNITYAP
jgi:hypothetical protein